MKVTSEKQINLLTIISNHLLLILSLFSLLFSLPFSLSLPPPPSPIPHTFQIPPILLHCPCHTSPNTSPPFLHTPSHSPSNPPTPNLKFLLNLSTLLSSFEIFELSSLEYTKDCFSVYINSFSYKRFVSWSRDCYSQ